MSLNDFSDPGNLGGALEHMDEVVILMPVFNDWRAVGLLLPQLDEALGGVKAPSRVLLVDDGSTASADDTLGAFRPHAFSAIDVLRLRRNLGHQRAIAIGLTYLEQHSSCGWAVVMDGDGEDDPWDVPRLLDVARTHPRAIVFAARKRRSEGALFRVFYYAYRILHRIITGLSVNVGNFSAVPRVALRQLVVVPELWNHYAAAVVRARVAHRSIPTRRASRLAGKPTMNFVALVGHGLSAFAVHGEVAGVRLLVATLLALVPAVGSLLLIVLLRFWTTLAIPGWATSAAGLALVIVMQLVVLAGLFTMFVLNSRAAADFIPLRDYSYFIDGVESLFPSPIGGTEMRDMGTSVTPAAVAPSYRDATR